MDLVRLTSAGALTFSILYYLDKRPEYFTPDTTPTHMMIFDGSDWLALNMNEVEKFFDGMISEMSANMTATGKDMIRLTNDAIVSENKRATDNIVNTDNNVRHHIKQVAQQLNDRVSTTVDRVNTIMNNKELQCKFKPRKGKRFKCR